MSVPHPAIVKAVKFSMKIADDALTNNVLYKDYLASKNIGDKVGVGSCKVRIQK